MTVLIPYRFLIDFLLCSVTVSILIAYSHVLISAIVVHKSNLFDIETAGVGACQSHYLWWVHQTGTVYVCQSASCEPWLWLVRLDWHLHSTRCHLLIIRKLEEVQFSNMTFMNLSQHYNTQITVYNHVPVSATYRIIVISPIRYNILSVMQSKYNMAGTL
jgi:hypothetical protein